MEKGRKPSLPALFSLIADARRYALQDWVSLPGTVAVTEGPLRARRRSAPRHASETAGRSEEHTSELQSLMRISYAGFCLKKKKKRTDIQNTRHETISTQVPQYHNTL